MNEQIMKDAGFTEMVNKVKCGVCPFCDKEIKEPSKEFRDKLSLKEYEISGLCQNCQDEFFGV